MAFNAVIWPDLAAKNRYRLFFCVSAFYAAIKVIADKQGGNTRGLIDDILAAAKVQQDSGNASSAARILNSLPELVPNQDLPPQSVVATATNLEKFRSSPNDSVSQAALNGLVALASYRSSITATPPDFHPAKSVSRFDAAEFHVIGGRLYISDALLQGNAIDNSGGHGFDIDNAVLKNVVLNNVKIVYRGGPVSLNSVHFVDCTLKSRTVPELIDFSWKPLFKATVRRISDRTKSGGRPLQSMRPKAKKSRPHPIMRGPGPSPGGAVRPFVGEGYGCSAAALTVPARGRMRI